MHPHAREIISSVFDKELHDNFVLIDRRFGESNYKEVNEKIGKQLSSM